MFARAIVAAAFLAAVLAGCGGSGGGTAAPPVTAPATGAQLTASDVERIVGQAVGEAQARGARAQVAIVDRVGNVLAVYAMPGTPNTVLVLSGLASTGGLETRKPIVPSTPAAIAKAITGAYLSSNGNAFSTRTAGQIIQAHFNPNESQQPSGPLFGVQFSQLTCSDVMRKPAHGSAGPKRSPLGLSADPGGLPLYKDGALVGGIGVELDGRYGLDLDLRDIDENPEEAVALAGTFGFSAPADIRADRITADGRSFRYVDSESLASDPARAAPLPASAPGYLAVEGFFDGTPRAGVAYGSASSGIKPDSARFAAAGAWVLGDVTGTNRFPPRESADGALSAAEVEGILADALAIAARTRGQIRRPLGSQAQVTISVVGTNGDILGLVRTPDGPVFGIDVSVQKARTAMFFSHPQAAGELLTAPAAQYLDTGAFSSPGEFVARMRAFIGGTDPLDGSIAWSARAIGNLHRPAFPDGIDGTPAGPLSTPASNWSPFNVGLQLDIVNNQLVRGALGDLSEGCAGRASFANQLGDPGPGMPRIRNGLQIFPGGVPIYRGNRLVGVVGVSGDGVDQDDMIAFLGLHNAGVRLGNGIGNAPAERRADRLTPQGTRLRYVQCPQSPFLDSSEQNACAGK